MYVITLISLIITILSTKDEGIGLDEELSKQIHKIYGTSFFNLMGC